MGAFRHDPALDRWNEMREGSWAHFKLTRRNTKPILLMTVAIPLAVYWLATSTDNKFDMVGRRKTQSLLRNPSPSAAESTDE